MQKRLNEMKIDHTIIMINSTCMYVVKYIYIYGELFFYIYIQL